METPNAAPGFYGKLPARGDFIGRRFARPFVDVWDNWLQEAMLACRSALGPHWLETYLTSPVWRFALAASACGPSAVAGLVIPSVDKVGRYFPLMLGRELAPEVDPACFVPAAASWYQALEDLALSALSEGFDLASFDRPLPAIAIGSAAPKAGPAAAPAPPGRHIAFDADADAGSQLAALCRDHEGATDRRTLWWTSGSEHVAPCLLICPGLPSAASFPSLLDGDWPSRGWGTAAPSAASGRDRGAGPKWDREE